jgi:hypothetical protein
MNSLALPIDDTVASRGNARRRALQTAEADKIFTSLVLQRGFVRDLIQGTVRRITDPVEAADVSLDLYMTVRGLAVAVGLRSPDPIWQRYKAHFIGDQNREKFFAKLRHMTRRIASAMLFTYPKPEAKRNQAVLRKFLKRTPSLRVRKLSESARTSGDQSDPALQWDSTLLPKSIAPSVLRLAILHERVLEEFLPRFFFRASDDLAQDSTYRRALLILNAVSEFGWSAEKHTKRLIEFGSIKATEKGSERETTKKFIRDLRRRHKRPVL